jgi:hypothetical protein
VGNVSVGDCGGWCRYCGVDGDEGEVVEGTNVDWNVFILGGALDKDTDMTLAICLARCSLPDLIRCK